MFKTQAMQLDVHPLTEASRAHCDLVVVGVFEGGLKAALAHPMIAHGSALMSRMASQERFTGGQGQRLSVLLWPQEGSSKAQQPLQVVLSGMGPESRCGAQKLATLGGTASRLAHAASAATMAIVPPAALTSQMTVSIVKGVHLGQYRFDAYRGKKARAKLAAQAPHKALRRLLLDGHGSKDMHEALRVGSAVAMAVRVARDLVNCPPNDLYPESFADKAAKLARKSAVRVKILDAKELRRRGMGMLLGVGQGSERPPCLVHVSYSSPGKSKTPPTLLVGKGITFDSGGLCIKGCDAMGTMKMDMGGAAAVLATVVGAATLKLDVHVEGILALAENMPSGRALRTGDVLVSALGLTVEVNNTDAEGRLVLGDALHYGIEQCAPKRVVDVATLTGACMVALGPNTTGLFANDDALATAVLAAANASGEDMWRMPLTESLADQLRSDVADMRNTGDRLGGAITAALFLQRFVGDVPWAHLDIAGPAWANSESATRRKGGTGAAVCSLMELLLQEARHKPETSRAQAKGRRTRGH